MQKINKIMFLATLISVILVTWNLFAQIQQKQILGTEKIPQDIIDTCKKEKESVDAITSDPDCLAGKGFKCIDGWSHTYYYDERFYPEGIKLTHDEIGFLKEPLKGAIAKRTFAGCRCTNPINYFILHEEKKEETTCESFYKFIEDYNAKCNGCVKTIEGGCC